MRADRYGRVHIEAFMLRGISAVGNGVDGLWIGQGWIALLGDVRERASLKSNVCASLDRR